MTMIVSLTDELGDFVKAKIDSGRFATASDVVSHALRLLAVADAVNAEKIRWLRQACADGIASGDAGEIDFDELREELRQHLAVADR